MKYHQHGFAPTPLIQLVTIARRVASGCSSVCQWISILVDAGLVIDSSLFYYLLLRIGLSAVYSQ
jgi:hypothetical protein